MSDLFAAHRHCEELLQQLATSLLQHASYLGLHAWYRSDPQMQEAAEDAENAARILIGLEPNDE